MGWNNDRFRHPVVVNEKLFINRNRPEERF
jgi:hypothetical protein